MLDEVKEDFVWPREYPDRFRWFYLRLPTDDSAVVSEPPSHMTDPENLEAEISTDLTKDLTPAPPTSALPISMTIVRPSTPNRIRYQARVAEENIPVRLHSDPAVHHCRDARLLFSLSR